MHVQNAVDNREHQTLAIICYVTTFSPLAYPPVKKRERKKNIFKIQNIIYVTYTYKKKMLDI